MIDLTVRQWQQKHTGIFNVDMAYAMSTLNVKEFERSKTANTFPGQLFE